MLKTMTRCGSIYCFGGFLYGIVEILAQGHTHWTMFFTGGICFLALYAIGVYSRERRWKQWLMGAAIITTVEFLVGGIVNLLLDLRIWDYSSYPLNLLGQICLFFSILWFFLSIPGIELGKLLHKAFR